jgi:hypothetical protein
MEGLYEQEFHDYEAAAKDAQSLLHGQGQDEVLALMTEKRQMLDHILV